MKSVVYSFIGGLLLAGCVWNKPPPGPVCRIPDPPPELTRMPPPLPPIPADLPASGSQ